jgi:hypothetical protein
MVSDMLAIVDLFNDAIFGDQKVRGNLPHFSMNTLLKKSFTTRGLNRPVSRHSVP